MKNILIMLLVSLVMSTLQAQQNAKGKQYFTIDDCPALNQSQRWYYRDIEKKNSMYLVRDYFASNNKLMRESRCKKIKPNVVYDGKVVEYFENGQVKRSVYRNGNTIYGKEETFYENGKQETEIVHRDDKKYYCQYWDEDGTPQLINGSGLFVCDNKEENFTCHMEFSDSLVVSSFFIDPLKGDTVYLKSDKIAEYDGGLQVIYNGVFQFLTGKYPTAARRNGTQGNVFIRFMLDKEGNIYDTKVLRGIGMGCDELAVQAILAQKKWIPATHKDKPVNFAMTLPIAFRLN